MSTFMLSRRPSSLLTCAAVSSLLLVAACDSSATTPPPVVENVSYVTNVYTQPQSAVFTSDPAPPTVVAEASSEVSIPACDEFFAQTETCAQTLTSDPAALATFEGQVQAARSEALRAGASHDPGQIAHAASACMAAESAYRIAPCG
jgi:hypothetical protein